MDGPGPFKGSKLVSVSGPTIWDRMDRGPNNAGFLACGAPITEQRRSKFLSSLSFQIYIIW